jgi:hypothetical protein
MSHAGRGCTGISQDGAQEDCAWQSTALRLLSRLRMRSIFLTFVVLLAMLAGSCARQISEMPTWVGFDEDNVEGTDDVAVVVIKVAPTAQVLLAAGRIGPNGWRSKSPAGGVWLSARDGFVVARVSPTQDEMAYAVIQVRPDHLGDGTDGTAPTYETGFWSALPGTPGSAVATEGPGKNEERLAYGPTGEARVPVFKAIAQRVTFAGTIGLDALPKPDADGAPQKVGITPVTSPEDIMAVTRFLAQHYPKVRARVVPSPLQMMRRDEVLE